VSLFGIVKGVFGSGPLVGDLIKLDREAQRDVADGIKYGLIILASAVAFIGFVFGAILVKIAF